MRSNNIQNASIYAAYFDDNSIAVSQHNKWFGKIFCDLISTNMFNLLLKVSEYKLEIK